MDLKGKRFSFSEPEKAASEQLICLEVQEHSR